MVYITIVMGKQSNSLTAALGGNGQFGHSHNEPGAASYCEGGTMMAHDELRLIVASKENGEGEGVIFTQDLESPALDLIPVGQDLEISVDCRVDDSIPLGFPIESWLDKRW